MAVRFAFLALGQFVWCHSMETFTAETRRTRKDSQRAFLFRLFRYFRVFRNLKKTLRTSAQTLRLCGEKTHFAALKINVGAPPAFNLSFSFGTAFVRN